jgi:hypothetical protein
VFYAWVSPTVVSPILRLRMSTWAHAAQLVPRRPRGDREPTPDEAWPARTSIPPEDRVSCRDAVEAHRCTVRDECRLTPQGPWPVAIARSVDRDAVSRACVERGLLQFKRTRMTPPVPHRKAKVVR